MTSNRKHTTKKVSNQKREQLNPVVNNFVNVAKSIPKSVINLAFFLSSTNRIKKYDKILNDQVG